ncbi:MAG: hypothetical protein HQ530_00455 [Parcubacteria group bacterium]|nr:hypothetical protein [Parcubacteria group bacterium]
MNSDQDIIQSLSIIESAKFECLINFLLYQGAFQNILDIKTLIDSPGINMEESSTRKSPSFTDAEIKSLGIYLEHSTNKNWQSKLKEDVKKNKGKKIKTFVFASNRELGDKNIKINGVSVPADEYCKKELECEKAFIIGRDNLLFPLTDPKFFHIRRNYLNMKDDLLVNYERYQEILREGEFSMDDQRIISSDIDELKSDIFSNNSKHLLVYCINCNFILHLMGMVAQKNFEEQKTNKILQKDFAFIRWPSPGIDLNNYLHEIKDVPDNYTVVWNAHIVIKNLFDYLKLKTSNNKLVFVTDENNKDEIINFFRENNLPFGSICFTKKLVDVKKISLTDHKNQISSIFVELERAVLGLEALIYSFSPFYEDNIDFRKRVIKYLGITKLEEKFIIHKLLKSKILYRTGNILWLKNANTGKQILKSLIDDDVFKIEELVKLKKHEE